MGRDGRIAVAGVIGPDGEILTLSDLPSTNTKRWVIRRKAQVVAAVEGGLISLGRACQLYRLSIDEYLNWERTIRRYGLNGLRATRAQRYRLETRH